MNVNKILNSRLINKAELARLLWPDVKGGVQYLNKKINQSQGKRITEKDIENIKTIIENELI